MPEDYSNSFEVNVTPKAVFIALTEQIDLWWTAASNEAREINDRLRVEFGDNTFKVMKVIESNPEKLLIWLVTEAHIGHEELIKKDEWVGTKIQWTIHSVENGSRIEIIHQGLTSQMECWNACIGGWDHFLGSLQAFLNYGKGTPFNA